MTIGIATAVACTDAHGWSHAGHADIGAIAARMLTANASAQIRSILGDKLGLRDGRIASSKSVSTTTAPSDEVSDFGRYVNFPRFCADYEPTRLITHRKGRNEGG